MKVYKFNVHVGEAGGVRVEQRLFRCPTQLHRTGGGANGASRRRFPGCLRDRGKFSRIISGLEACEDRFGFADLRRAQ